MENPGQQIPLWHMFIYLLLKILILKLPKNLHASFLGWRRPVSPLPSGELSATRESLTSRTNSSAYVRLAGPGCPSSDSFFYCSRTPPGRLLFSPQSGLCAVRRGLWENGREGNHAVFLCSQSRKSANKAGARADGRFRGKLSSRGVLICRWFSRREEFETFFRISFYLLKFAKLFILISFVK
jgi:hypothetical protein